MVPEPPMISSRNDRALSEVIGFVLILGLIVVVSSLYLAYGVPAQGRENEILHMNEIKDQFVAYKLSLDSLFTNNKVGTTLSNSFNLGTSGGYTQGSFSIIPIMSPVNSGGTISINQRTSSPETLTISSQSLILNDSVKYKVDLPAQVNYTPSHVYVNISGIQQSDLNQNGIFGATANTTAWSAIVNLTPQVSFYQNYYSKTGNCAPSDSQNGTAIDYLISSTPSTYNCLVPINIYNYTRSDLTITITKGNIVTMQNYAVYEKVAPGTTYAIDLMDDAYGLKSLTVPLHYISLNTGKTLGSVTATGNITYDFSEMNPYSVTPIPLGSIDYRAQNNYWIPQTYYYQLGGVFLTQSDGNTTYKLPPEITFSYDNQSDPAKKIVTVNINALTIDQNNVGVVGGNSLVQIKTRLTNITTFPYAVGSANTKWIRIGIHTTDNQARTMWSNYFNYTATVAGVPNFVVGLAGTESYIRIDGYDSSPTGNYDINVIASNATYSTSVHGIGGIVQ